MFIMDTSQTLLRFRTEAIEVPESKLCEPLFPLQVSSTYGREDFKRF